MRGSSSFIAAISRRSALISRSFFEPNSAARIAKNILFFAVGLGNPAGNPSKPC